MYSRICANIYIIMEIFSVVFSWSANQLVERVTLHAICIDFCSNFSFFFWKMICLWSIFVHHVDIYCLCVCAFSVVSVKSFICHFNWIHWIDCTQCITSQFLFRHIYMFIETQWKEHTVWHTQVIQFALSLSLSIQGIFTLVFSILLYIKQCIHEQNMSITISRIKTQREKLLNQIVSSHWTS